MSIRRVTISFPWPWTAAETRDLLAFVFQVALVTYLGFYLLETLTPGLVSYTFTLDAFLKVAIVCGILSAVWPAVTETPKKIHPIGWPTWLFIGLMAVGSAYVIWLKIQSIGSLAKPVAILSGLIVAALSLLVYYDRDPVRDSENKIIRKED